MKSLPYSSNVHVYHHLPTEEKIKVTKKPPTHPADLKTKGRPNIPTP